jgi:ubiquinone/menaquinone biosynthesis C-methylase UbiE
MTAHHGGGGTTTARLFSLAAPAYDFSYLQRWLYQPAQDEMIALLKSHRSRNVADIGCGTGILADRVDRELHPDAVYGVDMSEGMLAQARARSTNVTWLTSPAEKLPFDDGALDAIVTTTAFHFFDQPAALREFHRVLAPGGVTAVATLSHSRHVRLPGRLAGLMTFGPHHPGPAEMRTLFADAGFAVRMQRRVHRPAWSQFVTDTITVGCKPGAHT